MAATAIAASSAGSSSDSSFDCPVRMEVIMVSAPRHQSSSRCGASVTASAHARHHRSLTSLLYRAVGVLDSTSFSSASCPASMVSSANSACAPSATSVGCAIVVS